MSCALLCALHAAKSLHCLLNVKNGFNAPLKQFGSEDRMNTAMTIAIICSLHRQSKNEVSNLFRLLVFQCRLACKVTGA